MILNLGILNNIINSERVIFSILVIFGLFSGSSFFLTEAAAQELRLEATRIDTDGDGIPDSEDNCPRDINRDQKDTDGDGIGDVCDELTQPERPSEKSDLIIESLTHSPDNPVTGEKIEFKAVVKNIGVVDAGKSTLEFRIGGETSGPENRFDVPALAPGKTFTQIREASFDDVKNYGITAIADIFDALEEENEDNNKKVDTFSVKEARPPDSDDDGVPDKDDNCPRDPNRDQKDSDDDGVGDVCDVEEEPVMEPISSKTEEQISSRTVEQIEDDDKRELEITERPKVPTWVKTTAQFWVDGNVGDQDFTGGIGFLIQEKIIDVDQRPPPPRESDSQQPTSGVPDWIRKTTGWWIEGTVPEDQFLEGIKWLVKEQIILVKQKAIPNPQMELEYEGVEQSPGLSKASPAPEPLSLDGQIDDPNKYIGVWRAGNYNHALWLGDNWNGFIDKGTDLANDGYHLIDFERSENNGATQFNGVWKKATGSNVLISGKTWGDFLDDGQDRAENGFRLVDVERYVSNNQAKYNGVWVTGDYSNFVVSGKTWNNFKDEITNNAAENLRLTDLESYSSGNQQMFFGVYASGNYDYGIQSPMDWGGFVDGWKLFSDTDRRLVDIERFDDNGIKYAGLYHEGTDGYALWYASDREEFISKWKEYSDDGLRLVDMEIFPSQCTADCLNNVVRPEGKFTASGNPKTDMHCEGIPSSCPGDPSNESIKYTSPVDEIDDKTYLRVSVINEGDQIFTLPFNDEEVEMSQTWIYNSGNYHHAKDYSMSNGDSFDVLAAAPGTVIFADWTSWGGNAVIISHDVGNKKDVYRTIYKHLKNGSQNDCTKSLTVSLPSISDMEKRALFQSYLDWTFCQNVGNIPNSNYWGELDETFEVEVGDQVSRGELIGHAGNTGPGGIILAIDEDDVQQTGRNIHLHIYFAKRDLSNNNWYLIDPYGIYSQRDCYPDDITDPINTPCSRYQIFWKDGIAKYP